MTRARRSLLAIGVSVFCIAGWQVILYAQIRARIGISVDDYITQYGHPDVTAKNCHVVEERLRGLSFTEASEYSDQKRPFKVADSLLVYLKSADASFVVSCLSEAESFEHGRSVHYSQRKLFGSERLIIVGVNADGVVADIRRERYNWLAMYEGTPYQ